jgi:hypothetical protein
LATASTLLEQLTGYLLQLGSGLYFMRPLTSNSLAADSTLFKSLCASSSVVRVLRWLILDTSGGSWEIFSLQFKNDFFPKGGKHNQMNLDKRVPVALHKWIQILKYKLSIFFSLPVGFFYRLSTLLYVAPDPL